MAGLLHRPGEGRAKSNGTGGLGANDLVNAIVKVKKDANNKPVEPVVMESVTIVESGD